MMAKRKQNRGVKLAGATRDRVLDPDLIPDSVTINNAKYEVHAVVNAGISGVVWKCRNAFGRDRAVKLAIRDHYDARSYMEEMTRAGQLEPYTQFAKLYDAGICEVTFKDGRTDKFVDFIEEWVDGYTLKQLIAEHPEKHTVSLFRAFVDSFASVLAALEAEELRHDDLNPGNVMVVPPKKGDLDQVCTVKVIDLASLKPASKPTRKPRDDHRWLVEHLVTLWNAISKKNQLSIRDRRFLAEAEKLMASMLEDDLAIRLAEPEQIRDQFNAAYTRCQGSRQADDLTLADPFEFISAEHIWDDRLLVRLFARSCPWLPKVVGPDPCLVTGPRGCGKSTIFRWLSLKAQLLAHPDWPGAEFDSFEIAGFYISCSSDLQNRFAWVKTDALASRFGNEIVHYFNLLALREVLQTLRLISDRQDRETFWGFGPEQERSIHRFVLDQVASSDRHRVQGVSLVDQAIDVVESEMFHTHAGLARRRNMASTTSLSFLGDFTEFVVKEMPVFRTRRMAFLVDDYSVHRLPEPVQITLNRIIWERRDSHVFKLSSEKYGTTLEDDGHVTAELARELVEIDCGQEFIALDDRERQDETIEFAKELLDNRLKEAGYEATTEVLIGDSHWPESSLGRALREKKNGRKNDQYHGIQCIAQLCSGDVASLLLVYRRIFSEGRVTKSTTKPILTTVQHKAIRYISQRMFERIRSYHPLGPEMYEIVNHFGRLVRNILEKGKMQSHGKGQPKVPPQCPRIEIDQQHGAVPDQLNRAQYELARELVRRAIFIEMEPGLSRKDHVTTLRWQLKRILLPAFNAALSKNDAVKRDPDWFKYFLTNPKEACESSCLFCEIGAA